MRTQVLDAAAKFLATLMTEQELKDTAAFFESPTGKNSGAQPALGGRIAGTAEAWRQQLSTDMLARAHEEMKKKGQDF